MLLKDIDESVANMHVVISITLYSAGTKRSDKRRDPQVIMVMMMMMMMMMMVVVVVVVVMS